MLSKYAIHINTISELQIRVLIIGGEKQGESIIIMMRNKVSNEIYKVVLIDSFGGIHSLLKHYQETLGFHCLNSICWTHPHDDHTLDLKDILDDANLTHLGISQNDTCFVLPQFLDKFDKNSRVIGDYGDIINKKPKRKIGISDAQYERKNVNWDFVDDTDGSPHQVCLHFVTPLHDLGQRFLDIAYYDQRSKYNEMSLSCILMIDRKPYVYFGGDTEDNQIDQISDVDKSLIGLCEIVKVPHHGSNRSQLILSYINSCLKLAIFTIFKQNDTNENLPDAGMIERYREILDANAGTFHITDEPFSNAECKYGVVEFLLEYDEENYFVSSNYDVYGLNQQYERIDD